MPQNPQRDSGSVPGRAFPALLAAIPQRCRLRSRSALSCVPAVPLAAFPQCLQAHRALEGEPGGDAEELQAVLEHVPAALGLFALSVVGDQFVPREVRGRHMFEDGLKFLGIAAWLAFQGSVCLRALRDRS